MNKLIELDSYLIGKGFCRKDHGSDFKEWSTNDNLVKISIFETTLTFQLKLHNRAKLHLPLTNEEVDIDLMKKMTNYCLLIRECFKEQYEFRYEGLLDEEINLELMNIWSINENGQVIRANEFFKKFALIALVPDERIREAIQFDSSHRFKSFRNNEGDKVLKIRDIENNDILSLIITKDDKYTTIWNSFSDYFELSWKDYGSVIDYVIRVIRDAEPKVLIVETRNK